MWSRFGTPTGDAESGTEEEFNLAVNRYHENETITISFLFKNSPIPQSILDGEQYAKVQKFKKQVSAAGCLYREFSDDASFTDSINLILERAANQFEKVSPFRSAQSGQADKDSNADMFEAPVAVVQEPELGLFDYQEILSENSSQLNLLMSEWGQRLVSVGDVATTSTEELNNLGRFGRPDSIASKKIIDRIANHINEVADWGEDKENLINDCMERISDAISGLVSISDDFEQSKSDRDTGINSMRELISGIDEANGSLQSLSSAMLSLPRLSKFMNKATKRMISMLDNLIVKNNTFKNNVEISVSEMINMNC